MRVLFWSGTFRPFIGGAETLAAHLLPALNARGHEFLVVTSQGHTDLPAEDAWKGIPVRRFPFRQALAGTEVGRVAGVVRDVRALKKGFAPDLVHVNSVGLSVFFHLATAHVCPAPSLVTLNQFLPAEAAGRDTLQGESARRADWVACCSQAVLAGARELVPELASRSSVIYNGMAPPEPPPAPLPMQPPMLLCLGRLIHEKGFDLALSALVLLRKRSPSARLLIAGGGVVRPALEEQVRRLGVSAAVEFLGWVPPESVPALINRCTLMVVPSRWEEPFGFVALEAALMARPVVASRAGGLPEVVVHDRTGLLVEKEDAAALAAAVERLLARPEWAAEMGRAARSRALEAFSLERLVDSYDALYHGLTGGAADPFFSRGSQVGCP